MKQLVCSLVGSLIVGGVSNAQEIPDPLEVLGKERTAEAWMGKGRPATMKILSEQVYGVTPKTEIATEWKLDRESEAFGGKAIRREYLLTFAGKLTARVLVYAPKGKTKVPAFMGLNFDGNHTLESDPWLTESGKGKRGQHAGRWQVPMIIEKGMALVTIHCADFDPDEYDEFKNGVHALFPGERDGTSWGSLNGWAWGMSRVLDQLSKVPEIDETRVAVIGFSRMGKTAIWAGAQDERFAMVVSNNSGCGGAALSKRCHGETVGRITKVFPHWFCGNYAKYSDKEDEMPFDQHQLLACIAPRPLYVASASKDDWADPEGEFLSLVHAAPVYALFEEKPFDGGAWPKPGASVGGKLLRYHIREGKHDITAWDWERYLAAAGDWLK
ncbi:acetylxylan esterase [Akkermansiaceae bacterium]|nr:acetylxylan esterase [Akkermansiaceae bacterium]